MQECVGGVKAELGGGGCSCRFGLSEIVPAGRVQWRGNKGLAL